MNLYEVTDFDREIWQEELEDFVPRQLFDAHIHIWDEGFARPETPASDLRFDAGYAELKRRARKIFPGRECHYLLLASPIAGIDFAGYREWCADQAEAEPQSTASIVVTPGDSPEGLAAFAARRRVRVLKPYRSFAADPAMCRICDYLPEALIEIADHFQMTVVLHLSRRDGAADPENLADLEYLDRKYPRVTWQLAHCARAFNSRSLEKSIHRLKHLEHITYDTSAVCDLYSFYLLLKHENPNRILYGSDLVAASACHGNYITWGRAWEYFPGMERPHCDSRPTMVVYESLRALKRACDILELGQSELESIFCRNAQRLFFG